MKGALKSLPRTWPAVVVGVLLLILLIALGTRGGNGAGELRPRATPEVVPTSSTATRPSAPVDTQPPIAYADLTPEARATILLIDDDGPFPYDRDGAVFANREGLLPKAPRGTYREYTVRTPGERDRGARRIVAARDGTLYYTDDHYQRFRKIER